MCLHMPSLPFELGVTLQGQHKFKTLTLKILNDANDNLKTIIMKQKQECTDIEYSLYTATLVAANFRPFMHAAAIHILINKRSLTQIFLLQGNDSSYWSFY